MRSGAALSKDELYGRLLTSIDTMRPPIPEPEPPVIHVPGSPEIERMEGRLSEYVRLAWRVVEPATVYLHNWHIDAICEHLEAVMAGQIRNLLINMPPRHMKSLTVSVFWPTWAWIEHPEIRWLFSSYAEALSIRDSLKCRRIIQSPWYQTNWGDIYQLTSDQNVKGRFENNRTGYRLSTSVESGNTGEGGDLVICDDPHNVKEAPSQAKREAALIWWDETMSTRLNNPKTGIKVIIMQRVHNEDLAGHVLAQGGYEHLCLPEEYEPENKIVTCIGWEDPRKEKDELLWLERVGPEEVAGFKRTLGPYGYAAQFQQRPQPLQGGMFKAPWLRWYTKNQIAFDQEKQQWVLFGEPSALWQGVDPAISEDEAADDFVDFTIGITPTNKIVCLDPFAGHIDFIEQVTLVISKWQEWVAEMVGIETNAYQKALKQQVIRDALIPVKQIDHRTDKYTRIETMVPYFANGQVYLRAALDDEPGFVDQIRLPGIRIHEKMRRFYEQLVTYGPKAAKEDILDGLQNAISIGRPQIVKNEFYQ